MAWRLVMRARGGGGAERQQSTRAAARGLADPPLGMALSASNAAAGSTPPPGAGCSMICGSMESDAMAASRTDGGQGTWRDGGWKWCSIWQQGRAWRVGCGRTPRRQGLAASGQPGCPHMRPKHNPAPPCWYTAGPASPDQAPAAPPHHTRGRTRYTAFAPSCVAAWLAMSKMGKTKPTSWRPGAGRAGGRGRVGRWVGRQAEHEGQGGRGSRWSTRRSCT